jgi:hypothetical protein
MGDIILSFFSSLSALFLELVDLVLELVALAELLLDRPHLLVEVVLLLGALHLLLHAPADLALDLEHLDLGLHARVDLFEALPRREGLEQLLSLFELQVEVGDDGVGEAPGVFDRGDGVERLRRYLLVELDVGLEGAVHRPHQRLDLDSGAVTLGDDLDLAGEEGLVAGEAAHPRAALALHQHLHRAVGQAQQLDDRSQGADLVDIALGGLVLRRLALGAEHQAAVGAHRLFERTNRPRAPHEERHHHVREDDDVAQRQQRDHVPRFGALRPRRRVIGALGIVVVPEDSHPHS